MKYMQKSLIVVDNDVRGRNNELNKLLDDGWTVRRMCSMMSSCSGGSGPFCPTCLVILERNI
jgi:hypothetical protein